VSTTPLPGSPRSNRSRPVAPPPTEPHPFLRRLARSHRSRPPRRIRGPAPARRHVPVAQVRVLRREGGRPRRRTVRDRGPRHMLLGRPRARRGGVRRRHRRASRPRVPPLLRLPGLRLLRPPPQAAQGIFRPRERIWDTWPHRRIIAFRELFSVVCYWITCFTGASQGKLSFPPSLLY
jgi:hypothetical protein